MRLSRKVLEKIGFITKTDETGEYWEKDGVKIWDFNDEYWVIDMLDQVLIEPKITCTVELAAFFSGCGLDLYDKLQKRGKYANEQGTIQTKNKGN